MARKSRFSSSTAQEILAENLKSLRKKVESGGTLSSAELAILQSAAEGSATPTSARAWVTTKAELAKSLGISRPTLDKWMQATGAPEHAADGRHSVLEWKRWMRETGRSFGDSEEGEQGSEVERLTAKGLALRNRKIEIEIAQREGELIERDVVVQDITQAAIAVRRELYRMASEVAPQLAGRPVAEIQLRLREKVDEALHHIHSSKWAK